MTISATLSISVHPSSLGGYGQGLRVAGRKVTETSWSQCQLCGLPFAGDPLIFFRDGDHRRCDAGNLLEACPACVLVQGAGRLTAAREILPIWLPELSQRGLNRLTSSLHELAYTIGLPVDFSGAPREDSPHARQILKVWAGLLDRWILLREQAGIRTVTDVVDICLARDPVRGTCPPRLIRGLRLLHRGRFYSGGRDIYPMFITRNRQSGATAAPATPLPASITSPSASPSEPALAAGAVG
ncbi:hypothetical protein AruPA_20205 [Acidiphilium sp. PA]|uniref:hypothetical protein n=1 Tax=Acidiphilium sp. PA TaxID=2871705 RepID=UPI00224321EB|nr:hypothetical protein [Acidiphilium sp. PA]MCW8309349.1 hypothetical protein [Acidiphilium sp. PA]